MNLTVLHDAWTPDPLTWIHRAEAGAIANELRRAGHAVTRLPFDEERIGELRERRPVLRLSDPVMFVAAEALSGSKTPYVGPGYDVMARCSDKYTATRSVAQHGSTCPETMLATGADRMALPIVLKPRWGSDSRGLRLIRRGRVPERKQTEDFIVQRHVRGAELTVGVLYGRAGAALSIRLPEGALYSFTRKYLLRPGREPVTDAKLAQRVRVEALRIAAVLHVDWAARIDFIHEAGTGRLYFLECDVAPLVGLGSAFEMSLSAGGIARGEQLDLLFEGPA